MKEIPLEIEGFEGRRLLVQDRGIFKPVKLYIDDKPVKIKLGKFRIIGNDGKEIEGQMNSRFIIDQFNSITIKGKTVEIHKSLKWYEYLWSSWTILLIFIGGGVGGGLGAAATCLNINLFRSRTKTFLKYLFSLIISLAAVTLWMIIAIVINQKFRAR